MHVQIETINGVCSARCPMCTIETWTRKINTMSLEELRVILEKFVPYREKIRFLTLHGFAEPLLDREMPVKVRLAKDLGFQGVGFASNATHLDAGMARELLEAGLDTIICSIDGIKKETHEAIRPRTDFAKVVSQVEHFIALRDAGDYRTRVMIRFIHQKLNREEWPEYLAYWTARIDPARRDEVVKFEIHNWGDKIENYENSDLHEDLPIDGLVCSDVFERMFIYSDGSVALCCADDNGFYDHGNVLKEDPIRIYNNPVFTRYRKVMLDGRILSLDHCENCTIPRSRGLKAVPAS